MILSAAEWSIVLLSLKVSLVAVALSLPVAFGLAWLLARVRFPGKVLVDALVHLPLVIPPVVTGWLLLILFGPAGPVGRWLEAAFGLTLMFRWTGAALAAAVMALPLMVRPMRLSIEAVDRRLEQAARTLGARRWRAFATVTLPLSLPGIVAGLVLGFARSIGEFGATITFVCIGRDVDPAARHLCRAAGAGAGRDGHAPAIPSVLLSLGALIASETLARRRRPERTCP